ncbi:unnamed protein product [Ilex paraguariensis]|uniref:Uncharacterized protein n=1 Tax=Ilex paraguariensis TaxID=185542 RepID=A0ABC8SWI6_9AQUA
MGQVAPNAIVSPYISVGTSVLSETNETLALPTSPTEPPIATQQNKASHRLPLSQHIEDFKPRPFLSLKIISTKGFTIFEAPRSASDIAQ